MKNNILVDIEKLQLEFERIKNTTKFSVKQIPFSQLEHWRFEEVSRNLVHSSGKFFKIEGLKAETNFGSLTSWQQPIINQPEVGIVGILTKKIGGVRYFLMQAKAEPGNINILQLAPTVQATESNYTQVHKGKQPLFLEFFLNNDKTSVLVERLQSEQGARFLHKRNRNMIVETDQKIDLPPNFYWLTLRQIKELLTIDDFVNMDARSVLSCVPLAANQESSLHSKSAIASWLKRLKGEYKCKTEPVALGKLKDWQITDWEVSHQSKRFFSVIAVSVEAEGREVNNWSQPLIRQANIGMIGFIIKKIKGVTHVLIQAKVEVGYIDTVELAPTVSYSDPEERLKNNDLPPFAELFVKATPEQIKSSVIFSEEGGRFYHAQNKYITIEIDEEVELNLPPNYIWMTFGQLSEFVRETESVNVETRSLLSCLVY